MFVFCFVFFRRYHTREIDVMPDKTNKAFFFYTTYHWQKKEQEISKFPIFRLQDKSSSGGLSLTKSQVYTHDIKQPAVLPGMRPKIVVVVF